MSYYERLSQGSPFHRAIKRGAMLQISPADESPESLRQFQDIIAEAEADPEGEGYQIDTHPCHHRSIPGWTGRVYDFAVIYFV
jgi:hypothetical protein